MNMADFDRMVHMTAVELGYVGTDGKLTAKGWRAVLLSAITERQMSRMPDIAASPEDARVLNTRQ